MKKLIILSISISLLVMSGCGQTNRSSADSADENVTKVYRAQWMQEARWGLMTHYLSDWMVRNEKMESMTVERWNELVDKFDVEALANQIESVGAKYYIFTIGQNSGYFCSPNSVYDQLTGIAPSHCSNRDLIKDIATALKARGIRFIAYLPAGAPASDRQARESLKWQSGADPNIEFQKNWEQVIAHWSKQWGTLVDGWWFDGVYWQNVMYRNEKAPNFKSFAAAARAGNPNSAVAFNPGVIYRTLSVTPYEDYTAGEINMPEMMSYRTQNGLADDSQLQILTYAGQGWGSGDPRYSADEIIFFSKRVIDNFGAFTWDVPTNSKGQIDELFINLFKTVGAELNTYSRNEARRIPLMPSWPKDVPFL